MALVMTSELLFVQLLRSGTVEQGHTIFVYHLFSPHYTCLFSGSPRGQGGHASSRFVPV
jgi:hypothetical protein